VGVKHIKFWSIAGGELVGKRGVINPLPDLPETPKMQTLLSLAFGAVSIELENSPRLTFTGVIYRTMSPTLVP
jgi:hypothetical protein